MERDWTRTSWVGGMSVILAAGLIGTVLLFVRSGFQMDAVGLWNALITGLLMVAFGGWGMASTSTTPYWAEVVLGAWLLVAPIVLRIEDYNIGWAHMVIGTLLVVLGLCGALMRLAMLRGRDRGAPMG